MSSYSVYILKTAQKSLASIPLVFGFRIRQTFDRLETAANLGEEMQGKYAGYRKIRVWPYQIIYNLNQKAKVIIITEVRHQDNVSYSFSCP